MKQGDGQNTLYANVCFEFIIIGGHGNKAI